MSREVAEELKKWILRGEFLLTERVSPIGKGEFKPMKSPVILAKDIMTTPVITARKDITLEKASKILVEYDINYLPIVDENGILIGIVTSWDIAKAVALGKKDINEIMTKKVITAYEDEPIEIIAKKMEKYDISGIPIIDKNRRIVGIVTSEDLSRLIGREK